MQVASLSAFTRSSTRRNHLIAFAVIALAAVVFLVDAAPRIRSSFGNSQDGMNGVVWASGADAITNDGLVESRLGAVAPGREVYAHHPPAIFLLTALAQEVGGDSEAALRAPAWLASLAAIPLTWLLLRRIGASVTATVCGIAALVGSEMFLLYGAMLNFEAIALPVAIATLLLVVETDGRRRPAWVALTLGLVGALVSWEGILLAGVISACGEWRARTTDASTRDTRRLAAGAAVGTVLTVAWLAWANQGITEVWSVLRMRTDATTAGVSEQIGTQVDYLQFNFSAWWLGLAAVGIGAVVLDPARRRWSHALLVAVPVAFLIGLSDGAYFHPYWNYWLVLTIAVFAATGADKLIATSRRRGPAFGCAALALLVVAPHVDHSPARQHIESGAVGADLLRDHPSAAGDAWVWPTLRQPDWWVTYYTHQPIDEIRTSDLETVAERDPAHPVLVWKLAVDHFEGPGIYDALASVADEERSEYLVVRADRLAAVVAAR